MTNLLQIVIHITEVSVNYRFNNKDNKRTRTRTNRFSMATQPSSMAIALASALLTSDPSIVQAQTNGSRPGNRATPVARTMTPEEIAKSRASQFNTLLNDPDPVTARNARKARTYCMDGDVTKAFAEVVTRFPDAMEPVEQCIGALTRQATDGQLLPFYAEMVDHGNAGKPGTRKATDDDARDVIQRITDGIKAGDNLFTLTPTVASKIGPGLAMDAGFTAAWSLKGEGMPVVKDEAKLHAATEQCAAKTAEPKACYVVGLAQGARAYRKSNPKTAALEDENLPVPARNTTVGMSR